MDDDIYCLGHREKLLMQVGENVEKILGFNANYNALVASEAFEQADITLSHIPQEDGPAPVKKAGHYTFWIRKLKPFVVIIDEHNGAHGKTGHMFFNELASILFGITHAEMFGYRADINLSLAHDLMRRTAL